MNDEAVLIRPLQARDAAAFTALRLQAIADAPSAIWSTVDEENGRSPDEVRARIEENDGQVVLGAFLGAQLIGIAGLLRAAPAQVAHKGVLWGLMVAPGQRRGGVARRLIDAILAQAAQRGLWQVNLSVNTENLRARQLYHSIGFASFGIEPRALRVGARFYDEEHMTLALA